MRREPQSERVRLIRGDMKDTVGKKWCFGFEKHDGAPIYIRRQELNEDETGIVLSYSISVDNREGKLWYKFSLEDKPFISHEVVDGVLVTLLPYALRGGYNITSELPVSNKLWFQITNQLIPQFCSTSRDIWHTAIQAPTVTLEYHPNRTATAMSCGIDSFTTFFQYTTDMPEKEWRIDTLTFFENGAHHSGTIGHSEKEESVFNGQLERVRAFCSQKHYPLVAVESNADAFLSDMFWRDSYHYTHAFRNAGFVLLLQKAIRTYYYAGVSEINGFHASLWDDTEKYEKWLLPNLSTDSTRFYSVSTTLNRIEKTSYISRFPETYDNLLVCYMGVKNCGKCSKCVRLLLTLDYLNLLDKYKNSVPVQMYQQNKRWYEQQMLVNRGTDPMMEEVYRFSMEQGKRYSLIDRCKGRIHGFVHAVYRKMISSPRKAANAIAGIAERRFQRKHKANKNREE